MGWVLGDQSVELANQLGVPAKHKIRVDPCLDREQAELVEARSLLLGESLVGDAVERRSAPERQRFAGPCGCCVDVAVGERPLGFGQPTLEAVDVELLLSDLQHVAAAARDEQLAIRVQRLAQLRNVDLHALRRRRGRLLAPELVDQAVGRYDLVGVDQEVREQRGALAAADIGSTLIRRHLEWAK